MAKTRVVTTAQCSTNVQVGNHVYNPGEDREIDLTGDEAALLEAQAAGPLKGMFLAVGAKTFLPIDAPKPSAPTKPAKE